jgi:hypothetical protein
MKSHLPKLVFISDTRMLGSRVRNLSWSLGLRHCLTVDSVSLSGGLALFWDESIDVTLLSQGDGYIDVTIKEDLNAAPWRATFVYGEPRVEKRKEMWDLLRDLCGVWTGPWMLIGDFNETMWQYEHFSETPRPEQQMMDFREVLSHCDLHDLGFTGLPWTYNNNQGGRRNVRVCLDRGVQILIGLSFSHMLIYLICCLFIQITKLSYSVWTGLAGDSNKRKPLGMKLCGSEKLSCKL